MKLITYPASSMVGQVTLTLRDPVEMAVMSKVRLKKYIRSVKDHYYPLKDAKHLGDEEKAALDEIERWLPYAHLVLNKYSKDEKMDT